MKRFERIIRQTFTLVANTLLFIGKRTGLTYNEVNIMIYYLLMPLSWAALFDVWLGLPAASIVLLLVWVGIFGATRHTFSDWCDRLFQHSVNFLNMFNSWGGNYVLNSVIICVLLPIIIYASLICLLLH